VWVREAQRGSAAALEQLFRAHWNRAYRAALLVVGDAAAAEDIAQESFLAAVRALDRFDRRRPFGPWLHRIVVNRAIDWGRARALRRELALDGVAEPVAAAEDIAQESFLAAVRALDRFDRRRPFGPWLHRIVVNRAIDWGRARALRRELALDGVAEPVAAAEAVRGGERTEELAGALASLVPEQRAVIVLRYLLDYTPGEIAELLDLPRGTVNSRLRRGLDRLGGELE
jgi:RNA polymerase sigma-70 factor, ECF subfamily